MKYTILFVLAALAMSIILLACSSSKNNADGGNARKANPSNINTKLLSKKWKHIKTKDSYNGEWSDVDSDNKVIAFGKDGSYSENKPGNNECTGGYELEGDHVVLTHSCNKVSLKCKVVELEKKKLVLSQMGRHGEVLYVYERIK